ncbi:hypothetical protein FNV43_RR12588 [Rhamnella rubrinervis]|uniref:GST N-terminal domain-containing protein n=1 Tax=Rhamnella rubrinervis TaxID=2594499 RepID=A0A8K0H7R0_9ROSA|nr:hypothetical protein FNV43_RR12588 [Rhamnella rubrinervis]
MENNVEIDINGSSQVSTTSEQFDINSWLPITASRKGKWWYSAFHNVTAILGAGILGLPFAVSQLGWIAGMGAIVISWVITFYSFWQLIELHEAVPGKRFDRYHELGQYCFGPNLGYWIIMPQQLTVQVATTIVYTVTGGKSLKKFFDLVVPSMNHVRQTYYILFYTCLQFLISQTPNFNSLKSVSLLAAVMSFGYSMIAFVASTIRGSEHHDEVVYGVRSHTTAGKIFDSLNGIGTIAFAFAGHSVALEIQATIPSTPNKSSKKPMWKGVVVAYIIVAFCYCSVAVSGFWAYGNVVDDDILISLQKPPWLIATANLMVFFHVIGSYQVFSMPIFDTIESCLVQKWHFTPGRPVRIIARSIYVAAAGFIGMCVPFFGGLLGFFGGLVFSSTSYYQLPPFAKEQLSPWSSGAKSRFAEWRWVFVRVELHRLREFCTFPHGAAHVRSRFFASRSWVLRRSRFHAKSADSDADNDDKLPTKFSRENVESSENGGNPSTSLLSFLCPLLKLFSGGDPSRERNYTIEVATSTLSTLARFPWGSRSLSESFSSKEIATLNPPKRLQIFEFEACPFCRRVREAITELDLSVEVYPCPKGSVRHRDMVRRFGGNEQFPFLVDPNTGISMYESGDIVKYLYQQYGQGRKPSVGLLESTIFTGWMPTILRAGRGMTLWENARLDPPTIKLELFSYENNPYARIVREALCELELPYILQNVGEGSFRSKLLLDIAGTKEIPYLIDPNTGAQVGDFKKILSYLFQTYSAATL